jgi:LmbE family N-acetylglucosaminyl deacetylase
VTASGRLVVLSPHLDDAVLSTGGLIARAVAAGRVVEVWTAFTSGPPPDTLPRGLRPFADYATRLREDDEALDLLGARARRLALPERIWRTPPPTGGLARMLPAAGLRTAFRTPGDLAGFAQLENLAALLAEPLADPDAELLAPLGIGHHVDHVEVLLAAVTAAGRADAWSRVGFYEDFYALGDAARRRHPIARRHPATGRRPGGRRGPASWRDAPGWAAPVEGAVLRLTPLIAAGPPITHYLPELAGLDWRCEPQPLSSPQEELKLRAVARYRSQLAALGGRDRLEAILRRAHRVRGGELIWRVCLR